MLSLDPADSFSTLPEELARYRAIGTGCGLGMADETVAAFGRLLQAASVPMVLDADALNILARHGNGSDASRPAPSSHRTRANCNG